MAHNSGSKKSQKHDSDSIDTVVKSLFLIVNSR
jgi:hypothetical protein